MSSILHPLLSNPTLYHGLRHYLLGGLPFRSWVKTYGLDNPQQRIADLGCGPVDILRYVSPKRHAAYYLGVDVSDRYLSAARQRSAAIALPSQFLAMDLDRLQSDRSVQNQLRSLLDEYAITTVLLLGVLHHINNEAALTTLNLVFEAPSVRNLFTWDVVLLPGHRVNNYFCRRDRGNFIRTEPEYDALAMKTLWAHHRKFWTSPGLKSIKYLHYHFQK